MDTLMNTRLYALKQMAQALIDELPPYNDDEPETDPESARLRAVLADVLNF